MFTERQRLIEAADVVRSQVPELGIMVISLDSSTANIFGPTRLVSGAAVIARLTTQEASIDLRPGDVIHAINGQSVYTVDNLKEALGTHG